MRLGMLALALLAAGGGFVAESSPTAMAGGGFEKAS